MAKNDTATDDDAMTQEMADKAMADAAANEEWETVSVGLGTEWDFEKSGPLVGFYKGTQDVELSEEKQKQAAAQGNPRKTATAHQFTKGNDGEEVFVWGSHELDKAMEEIGVDEKVRITFLGIEQFKADDGPRQVKRYKVERSKR